MKLTDITNYIGFTNTTAKEPEPPTEANIVQEPQGEKEVYLAWQDHTKVTPKNLKPKFVRSLMVSGFVAALLLATMGEFFLIFLIISIIFIMYALTVTPPEDIHYEISNHGVEIAGILYKWREFKHFFFSTTTQIPMLAVDTKERIPGRLYIKIDNTDKEKVKEIFSKYLPFLKEEPLSSADKAYYSFISKFNMSGPDNETQERL